MRWTLRISFLLFLAWAIFMVSPFVALYSLGKAVEARDLAMIRERVNFQALRISLTKQLVTDYLIAVGRRQELDGLDRQVASGFGATLADPLVAELVTPEALIDLLADGDWQAANGGGSTGGTALAFDLASVREALAIFVGSETRGFRNVYVPIRPESRGEEFRLHLRLSGTTWRLTGIELPKSLRQQLVKRLPRGQA